MEYRKSLESCKNRSDAISVRFDEDEFEDEFEDDEFIWANSQQNYENFRALPLIFYFVSMEN